MPLRGLLDPAKKNPPAFSRAAAKFTFFFFFFLLQEVCMEATELDGRQGRLRRGVLGTRELAQGDLVYQDDLRMPSSPYFPVEAQGGQGPPPMMQDRFQSVISQLFQHRTIRCGGPIDDDMANIIVAQLLYLDAADPRKLGKRYSLPNSRIMIHQPLGGAQGGQTDIDIQANEMLHHKATLNVYLAYHTGQSLERINQDTDRDLFMSAKEAKDYGLIDGVIVNPLKARQPLPASDQ